MRLVCILLFLFGLQTGLFAQNWGISDLDGNPLALELEFVLDGPIELNIDGCQTGDLLADANCILSLDGMTDAYTLKLIVKEDPVDHRNGVSTIDLVSVIRHILHIQPYDNMAMTVAADVNGDHKVSAVDVVQMRKLILGVMDSFVNTYKYRILKRSALDADGTNSNLASFYAQWSTSDYPLSELNVIAVSVGDVNNTTAW